MFSSIDVNKYISKKNAYQLVLDLKLLKATVKAIQSGLHSGRPKKYQEFTLGQVEDMLAATKEQLNFVKGGLTKEEFDEIENAAHEEFLVHLQNAESPFAAIFSSLKK